MRCARVDRLIEVFIDGRLRPSLAIRVQRHLDWCSDCRLRAEEARRVVDAFTGVELHRAPERLASRVIEMVYRESSKETPQSAGRKVPAPAYRRLGYSFMAAAALLSVSLFIPKLAYPNLIGRERIATNLTVGQPAGVARMVNDAGLGIREVVGEQAQSSR